MQASHGIALITVFLTTKDLSRPFNKPQILMQMLFHLNIVLRMSFDTFKTANINICDKLGIVPRSYIDVENYQIDHKFVQDLSRSYT